MRAVRQIMGMPITIEVVNCDDKQVFELVFSRLAAIDEKFSTYRPDSEVSRYITNKISEADLSAELKTVIKACRRAEKATNGYFSAWASGRFDPLGYVKGWAIAQAGRAIEKQGHDTYCISAGGDILAKSNSQKIWNIGIQDPTDKTKILNKLSILNGAVATSGSYERGNHIYNPKNKQPVTELLSVSVAGPDIIWADVLATSLFAMGKQAHDFIKTQAGYSAMIVEA